MKVYHGSCVVVEKPDVLHSRRNVDFGPGFYVTPIYDQARKWSEKFKARNKESIVSVFAFDEIKAASEFKVCRFDSYTEEWLDMILVCRSGHVTDNYDIIIGGVANDKVFNTVELYFDQLIDKNEAIKRLRYEKPNLQICFRTQKAIDVLLRYEGSERL